MSYYITHTTQLYWQYVNVGTLNQAKRAAIDAYKDQYPGTISITKTNNISSVNDSIICVFVNNKWIDTV